LLDKAGKLRTEIARQGFHTTQFDTPIIPIILDGPERAKNLSSYLEENGIIAPFMNYPVMQELHMVRIAVSFSHTDDQTGALLDLLKKWIEK